MRMRIVPGDQSNGWLSGWACTVVAIAAALLIGLLILHAI